MKKQIIGFAAVVVAILLVLYGAKKIPGLSIKAEKVPEKKPGNVALAEGTIESGAGEVLAAENETKKLYLNTDTLDFRVEDKATGESFSALKPEGSVEDRSLMRITFVGEDGTFLYWNAYEYCVNHQTYTIDKIENGFRINLNLKETDSYRINEYMPQKITSARYKERFLDGIDELVVQGKITEEAAQRYLDSLDLVYAYNSEGDYYYSRLSLSPPISTVRQMVELTKLLNYTTDELLQDNGEFGISVTIEEPGSFIIPLEVVLDGDDLVVTVLTDTIVNENPYYMLTRIDLLTCFGATSPAEAEEGYIFVPDGCGALLKLNQFNSSYGTYSRAIYDNTYYNDYYYMPSYPETLHMPVYGMYYRGGTKGAGGYLAIIEDGADLSFVTATLASKDEGGSAYNRAYSGFDVTKYAQVSILGPYDSSGGLFLKSTGMMDTRYQLRYKLFTEEITYYDMASTYREYLMAKDGLSPEFKEQAKLYLEVTGALSVGEYIMGIPHEKEISMTDYTELSEILSELSDYPLAVSYLGVFDGGLDHQLMRDAKLAKTNGSKKELLSLIDQAKEKEQELFLGVDFTKIYSKGNGFEPKTHAAYNFNDSPIQIFDYLRTTGVFGRDLRRYHVLSPRYLSSVVDGFLKNAKDYHSFYVEDLAKGFFADYNKRNLVTPEQAQQILAENLTKLAEEKNLALNNPEIDKIRYGTWAVNIARESSGYGGFAAEIPFRQLVMNGLISYTTLNVNESGVDKDYFLLQALELGSSPKFTITAKSLDRLKNTRHADFISREYELIKEDIRELYDRYEEAFSKIRCMEIVNHKVLADGVFETTYANGVRVVTNYNMYSVTCEEGELAPLGFQILN